MAYVGNTCFKVFIMYKYENAKYKSELDDFLFTSYMALINSQKIQELAHPLYAP